MTCIASVSINMASLLEMEIRETVWRKLTGLPAGEYYITAADADLTVICSLLRMK